jgi:hypothetical protein
MSSNNGKKSKANKQWGTNATERNDAAPHCHIPMASQFTPDQNRRRRRAEAQGTSDLHLDPVPCLYSAISAAPEGAADADADADADANDALPCP